MPPNLRQDPETSSPEAFILIAAMCVAEVLGMLGVFAFPALLPYFLKLWGLSNGQAGWINGIYFAGYTAAVPLLTSITDRIDARRIYLVFCTLGVLANLGFAILACGFWSALLFRALSGIGLAGTFIPGLKALIDRLDVRTHPRAISFYTACFGLGVSISFYCAGEMFRWFGWKEAFGIAAMGSVLSLILSFLVLKPKSIPLVSNGTAKGHILDFRPVWKNRPARAYILVYMCHMWEMFAARSWLVVFLSFSITLQKAPAGLMAPTTVMAVAGIGGMMASIVGGELAVRLGRRRVVTAIMGISALLALTIGFSAQLPYNAVIILCLVYTLFFQGDSAAIHAGVITAAEPKLQGATMALQSLGGFAAASLGSVAAGMVLDLTGGGSTSLSWGLTFGSMGIAAALGPVLLHRTQNN
ncbi:MAG: MFS transporter [Desulfobacteraceae bacterium]|nr:MFS transporter [Desulfobacteraceae bacterium]